MAIRNIITDPINDLLHRPKGQIPAFDALRSLAVACVIAAHLGKAYLLAGGRDNWLARSPFVRGGWMGVDLFFVLSGYFIGRQLWRELAKTGTINFGRFVIRRGLRIWPLYFFFFFFASFVLHRAVPGHWWSDLLFITNYTNHGVVMGSWSLCLEEQFYIIAPLLLITGSLFAIPSWQYRKVCWSLLVLLPVIRAVIWWHLTGGLNRHNSGLWFSAEYEPFHTHSDGLIMGMLLANYEITSPIQNRKGFLTSFWALPVAVAACLALQKLQGESLDFTGLTLVFGSATWFMLSTRKRILFFLDSWIFYLLSRLSFGMYLNNEYFHERFAVLSLRYIPLAGRLPALHLMLSILLLISASAAISFVTFCLVEHPFLRLRSFLLSNTAGVSHVHSNDASGVGLQGLGMAQLVDS